VCTVDSINVHANKSEHIGKIPSSTQVEQVNKEFVKEVMKGVWGMPRLSEAKKDVISCDKLRGSANRT
jgi:hypothetical protein